MSLVSSAADIAISLLSKFASKSTVLTTVAGLPITAGALENGLGTLGTFAAAMSAAIKAKNYGAAFEIGAEEVATIANDVGVPYAGIAELLIPVVYNAANMGVSSVTADVASGKIVPDGRGGYVPTSNSKYDPKTGQFLDGPFDEGK